MWERNGIGEVANEGQSRRSITIDRDEAHKESLLINSLKLSRSEMGGISG
jgi:hypothetical protein